MDANRFSRAIESVERLSAYLTDINLAAEVLRELNNIEGALTEKRRVLAESTAELDTMRAAVKAAGEDKARVEAAAQATRDDAAEMAAQVVAAANGEADTIIRNAKLAAQAAHDKAAQQIEDARKKAQADLAAIDAKRKEAAAELAAVQAQVADARASLADLNNRIAAVRQAADSVLGG